MKAHDVIVFLAGSLVVGLACSANLEAPSAVNVVRDAGVIDFGVPEVRADDATTPGPTPATVDTVPCDKVAGTTRYAERAYAGRSKEDLARATALACGGASSLPVEYSCAPVGVGVQDGKLAAYCPQGVTGVTFIVPPKL